MDNESKCYQDRFKGTAGKYFFSIMQSIARSNGLDSDDDWLNNMDEKISDMKNVVEGYDLLPQSTKDLKSKDCCIIDMENLMCFRQSLLNAYNKDYKCRLNHTCRS